MRKLYIHFSRSTKKFNHFSRMLQWYEGLPISHVAVELPTSKGLGQNFVLHSTVGSGVSLISKKRFLEDNEVMESYTIKLEIEEYKKIRNAMLDDCGEEYAMMQNIGIFLIDVARRLGIISKNPFKKGQNCSELVYRHIISNRYQNFNIDPDLIKPSKIREILIKQGHTPIISKINNYSNI